MKNELTWGFFKIFFTFFGKLITSLYIILFLPLIFSYKRLGDFNRNTKLIFIIIATLSILAIRFLFYFSGYWHYSERYNFPLVVLFILLLPPGVIFLIDFFAKKFSKSYRDIFNVILTLLVVGFFFKGISYSDKKAYLRELGATIEEKFKGQELYILGNDKDFYRIAYYSGCYRGKDFRDKDGFLELIKNIKDKSQTVLIVIMPEGHKTDQFNKYLSESKDFSLVKKQMDHHDLPLNIYQYLP
jgi:hypothetical protein